MPDPKPDSKTAALRRRNSLNPHPEKVRDELFRKHSFFDARDLVQVRYEMLRSVLKQGDSVSASAERFGVTRPTWYRARKRYEEGGLPGLLPARPGPRRRSKLTPEVLEMLRSARREQPRPSGRELVRMVRDELGLEVDRRSIERALAGGPKKE